ncbi:MAG TPA: response regulator transcription factor [Nitriliruptorales bacterium]|nr:response regulator transcription factor [Nitriliruptorales bacterium]
MPETPNRLRLVVAEDEPLLRQGMVRLLREQGFQVVDQVSTADALLIAVATHRPDVAITDIRMPPHQSDEGLRAADLIRERFPETGVLVFSAFVETEYLMELVRSGAAGIGYLLKHRVTQIEQFADAVRRVAAGESAVDPEVVDELMRRPRIRDPLPHLTAREREVLKLMAEGRSNRAISAQLHVSPKTMESHVAAIFRKLGLTPTPDDHRRVLAVLRYLRA